MHSVSDGFSSVNQDDNDSPPVVGGGYVPASPKRNMEFHALFRSVPEDGYLINGIDHLIHMWYVCVKVMNGFPWLFKQLSYFY